jgi:predicted transcriptional regulator
VKTVSIKLPDGLDARLTAVALRRKVSKSTVIRAALERALRIDGTPRAGSALALARGLVGCLSGPGDLSTNKAYLKDFGRR